MQRWIVVSVCVSGSLITEKEQTVWFVRSKQSTHCSTLIRVLHGPCSMNSTVTPSKNQSLIDHIDNAVAELLKHKARLQLDIQKLQDGDIDLVKQAKQQYEDNQMSSSS